MPDSSAFEVTRPRSALAWRLAVAFTLGCAGGLAAFVFGIPGKGEFVPAIWLAGFIALILAPGWPGLIAVASGVVASAVVLDLSDGVFGLVVLVAVIVFAPAAHGALSATVLVRLMALGWSRGLRDAGVLAGGGLTIGLVVLFTWLAIEIGQSPP